MESWLRMGVARGQKQAVAGLRGFGDEGGIGVFVSQQLQGRETVALVRGLLQTDEVGVAIEQVAHHLALLSFLRDVALKHGHVPRQQFQGAVGRLLRGVEGRVLADGDKGQQQTRHGQPQQAWAQQYPEDEKDEVCEDDGRHQQPHVAQFGPRLRLEQVGVAHQ